MFSSPNNLSVPVAAEYGRLIEQTSRLGMSISVWAAGGGCVCRHRPEDGWWTYLEGRAPTDAQVQHFVDGVAGTGKSAVRRLPCGCVLLGVPIHERRRLTAVMAACYWPREMLAEEPLRRLCGQVEMDYRLARSLGETTCRHSADGAGDFLSLLEGACQADTALRAATDDLDELSLNLATTYEELSLVYRVSGTMKLTENPEVFFQEEVCQGLRDVLDVEGVVAFLHAHPLVAQEDRILVAGRWPLDSAETAQWVDALMAQLKGNPRGVILNAVEDEYPYPAAKGVQRVVAVALPGDKGPIGALFAANKRAGEFDSVDGKLIGAIAGEAGVFLSNYRLFVDVQELLIGVLDALTASIDAKDPYTCGHSRRVAILSRRLAEAMGLPPKRAERVYLAGLLHDIGKIGVPERILRKPGKLSDAEFSVIKRHPEISAKILGGIRQLEDVVPGIRHHHERIDGRGYPDGLKGEDIPLEGRIIGLADCFDALASNRVYRQAMPFGTVTDIIRTNAGTQFDAVLAEKLLSMDMEGFMAEFREQIEATTQLADELEEAS